MLAVLAPRTVREDEVVEVVDSVEPDWVVASGLLKADVKGDMAGSSLMGDGRRAATAELGWFDAARWSVARARSCCEVAFILCVTASLSRAISISSGLAAFPLSSVVVLLLV